MLIRFPTVMTVMFIASLLIVSACPQAEGEGEGEHGEPLPADTVIDGKNYGDWGADWWTREISVAVSETWMADADGDACGDRQSGDVFMLAGSDAADPVTRACAIPSGKTIYVPVINYLNDYPCPDPGFEPADGESLEEFLTAGAIEIIDPVTTATVELDGESIDAIRAHSSMFTFTGDISHAATDPCITGEAQQAVTDGYALLLTPLAAGEHTMVITASAPDFSQDVTYELTVQ